MSTKAIKADAVAKTTEEPAKETAAAEATSPKKTKAELKNTKIVAKQDIAAVRIDRGNVSSYELAVLYHPDLEIDLDKAEKKVLGLVSDGAGKVTNTDNWGKRKLAYPIKKQEHAVYVFYTFEMPGINVAKLEQTLNITDEVIRFMVTRPNLKAMAKAEALKAEKAKKAAERGDAGKEDDEEQDKDEQE